MRLDIAITYVISAAVKTADCLPMRDGNMLMPPRPHGHGGHSSLPAPPGVTASGLFQRPDYCRACTLWAAEKKGPLVRETLTRTQPFFCRLHGTYYPSYREEV